MALAVPLSRFTSRVGGGSAFFVRLLDYMPALILILVSAFAFGGIVGWFARARPTVFICLIAPLLLFIGEVLFEDAHEGWAYTADGVIAALFIDTVPFYFFLAVPCLIGGVLMNRVAYRVKRRAKI